MSAERIPSQPPGASAAQDAQLEAERAAENRRHRAHARHHMGQHHGVTFKHTAPGAQIRKPQHLEEGRRRLTSNGLPHKVTPRNGDGRGQGRQHPGGGQHRGGQQNGQRGGQQRQEQQQQRQKQPRDNPLRPRQQGAPRAGAADLRVRVLAAPGVTPPDQLATAQEMSSMAREPALHTPAAQSNHLYALAARWSDRPLLLETSLAGQWTELYLRTCAAGARSLAQVTLMLDMLAARELQGDLSNVPHYTLLDVSRLLVDALSRLDGLDLPDPNTEAGQSWYLLAPLGVLTGLRSRRSPLRDRTRRYLLTVRATMELGHP
jgi:hypothetical protein